MEESAPPAGAPAFPLPAFMQPATLLNLSPNLFDVLTGAFGSVLKSTIARPARGKLKDTFLVEKQSQTNWCWASVAVAVNRFFDYPPVSQCQVAQRTLRPAGANCCQSPGSEICNVAKRISAAFGAIGVARLSSPAQPQESLGIEDIRHDIARNRPVICAMAGGGTNHFVVVVAWYTANGAPWVSIDDPAMGGRRERSFDAFMTDLDGRRFRQATRLK